MADEKPIIDPLAAFKQVDANTLQTPDTLVSPPKRRGRPPGTTNKPKVDPTVEKQKKVQSITNLIVEDFNEQIISALIAAGVPPEAFYKPGQIPKVQEVSSAYTPLANQIVIKPTHAKNLAKFAVALEETDTGSKIVHFGDTGRSGLFVSGAMALVSTVMYLTQVNKVVKVLGPVFRQIQEAKTQAKAKEVIDVPEEEVEQPPDTLYRPVKDL